MKNFENHLLAMHQDKYTYLQCRMCCAAFRKECVDEHIKSHNNRGNGMTFMRREKLTELLTTDATATQKMSKFLRHIKIQLDFEYRRAAVGEYVRGFKFCLICNSDVKTSEMDEHLRAHNVHSDNKNYIPSERFQELLLELSFQNIMNRILQAKHLHELT